MAGRLRVGPHPLRLRPRRGQLPLAGSGQPPLQGLTLADLQEWRDHLLHQGQAASSINRHLAAVRSLLTFGQRTGYLQFNVGAAIQAPAAGGSAGGTDSLGTGYFESAPRGRGGLRPRAGATRPCCSSCITRAPAWRRPAGCSGGICRTSRGSARWPPFMARAGVPGTWRCPWTVRGR